MRWIYEGIVMLAFSGVAFVAIWGGARIVRYTIEKIKENEI